MRRYNLFLRAYTKVLSSRFNNSEKGATSHAIVHRALWEYLTEVNGLDDETEREKLRRETFEGSDFPRLLTAYV